MASISFIKYINQLDVDRLSGTVGISLPTTTTGYRSVCVASAPGFEEALSVAREATEDL